MSIRTSICGLPAAYETSLLIDVVTPDCRKTTKGKTTKEKKEEDFVCIWSNVGTLEILVEYAASVLPKQAVDSNEWNSKSPYQHKNQCKEKDRKVLLNNIHQWYTKGA